MTVQELSQLYYLNREIELDQRRLQELEAHAYAPTGANLTGMPRNPSVNRNMEKYAAEIVDLKAIIAAKQLQCIHERNRLERYIADVEDSLTRWILTLRFINGLPWEQVALHIGGGNTTEGVKKRCYRYLKSTEAPDPDRAEK